MTRHLVLFYISAKYHQNIVKGIRVTEQTRNHSNTRRGDKSKSKKAKVVIHECLNAMLSRPILHFYQVSSKYSKGHLCYTESNSNTRGDNSKRKKPKLSFLHATSCLVLFYISTKNHKNIPKGIQLTERTRNPCMITVKYNKGR